MQSHPVPGRRTIASACARPRSAASPARWRGFGQAPGDDARERWAQACIDELRPRGLVRDLDPVDRRPLRGYLVLHNSGLGLEQLLLPTPTFANAGHVRKRASVGQASAQLGGIPQFFAPSAKAGAGTRHRAGSGCVQTPDCVWPFMRSSCFSPDPTARSWWSPKSSSAPTAETGSVPLANLHFMSLRRDRGGSARVTKN